MDQKQLVDYAELIRLRETGMENKDIAAKFGVSLSTVIHGLRKGGWKGYQRNCALVGCGKEFWTGSSLESIAAVLTPKGILNEHALVRLSVKPSVRYQSAPSVFSRSGSEATTARASTATFI